MEGERRGGRLGEDCQGRLRLRGESGLGRGSEEDSGGEEGSLGVRAGERLGLEVWVFQLGDTMVYSLRKVAMVVMMYR